MGHCEPASGIAGIMKAVLALEHGVVPPILGLNKLNPNSELPDFLLLSGISRGLSNHVRLQLISTTEN